MKAFAYLAAGSYTARGRKGRVFHNCENYIPDGRFRPVLRSSRHVRRACFIVLATLLFAVWVAAGQSVRGSGVKPDYRGKGVVLAMLPPPSDLHATRPVIVIEHEPIAGLMDDKMSMPFIAASTALF